MKEYWPQNYTKTFVNSIKLSKQIGVQKAQTNIKAKLQELGFEVDYLEILDEKNLQPVSELNSFSRIFVAAYLGKTRLIDNVGVADVLNFTGRWRQRCRL